MARGLQRTSPIDAAGLHSLAHTPRQWRARFGLDLRLSAIARHYSEKSAVYDGADFL
jgi:hypothetical protein